MVRLVNGKVYDELIERIISLARNVSDLNQRLAQLELEQLEHKDEDDIPLDKLLTNKDGLLSYKRLRERRNGKNDNRD